MVHAFPRPRLLPLILAAIVLAGCATAPGTPSGGAWPPVNPGAVDGLVPPDGAAADALLAGEQQWMQQLFNGTPVDVQADTGGAVRVEVPLAYAFDDGQSKPKPPMLAVLDKVTQSMLRQPRTTLQLAPPGPAARERLAALRSYLISKGLAPTRLLPTAPREADKVLLRLLPPAQAASSEPNSGSALVRGR